MKTEDILSISFSGILVVCALVITGLVIRKEFFENKSKQKIRKVENWQELELSGRRVGPSKAEVQIVEFFDYQCPFCKRVQPVVETVRNKYPKKVSVTLEHFPLGSHEYAFEAAMAAECAGEQNSFKPFHELLFSNQDQLGEIRYGSLASEAGIKNIALFNHCLENELTASTVQAGQDLADKLGIDGIPTFIINGSLVSGALSEQQLEGLVKKRLNEVK